jgi:2-hydroxychromene-2-carboxylate isomerase
VKKITRNIEFFYDYVSPYSYLANHKIASFANFKIIYRPILLGAVMQATNNKPPSFIPEKGRYIMKDIQRWAKHYQIPLKMNSIFPQNTLNALRLAIVCQHEDCFELVHQSLFDAMFINNKNLSKLKVLSEIIHQHSLDLEYFMSKIMEDSIKDELKRNTDDAISRGVFGAPTFFIEDEMFFGNDRLDFILDATGDP